MANAAYSGFIHQAQLLTLYRGVPPDSEFAATTSISNEGGRMVIRFVLVDDQRMITMIAPWGLVCN